MHAYLSTKFEGEDNREIVEALCTAAERAGFTVTCTNRDYDDYGQRENDEEKLIDFMFAGIEEADVILLETTQKGMGLGIEAGYAAALRKPIAVLHTHETDVSPTLAELATLVISYHGLEDLTTQLSTLKSTLT